MSNEQFFYNRPTFPAQLDMSHPLTRGLVGCWMLNEDAPNSMRAWDSSPYQNHGLAISPLARWQGRKFDGLLDYINCGNNGILDFTSGDFAIFALVNSLDISLYQTVFEKGEANVDGYEFLIEQTSGKILFQTYQAAATQTTISTGQVVFVNVPNFIGVTRSGASAKLYSNALAIAQSAGSHIDPVSNTSNAVIGIRRAPLTFRFNGTMSYVVVYNRNINAVEILTLHLDPYAMFLR